MMRHILRFFFPPKCIVCDAVVENDRFAVCADCLPKLPKNTRACERCGTPLDTVYGELLCTECRTKKRAFTRAFVPFIYKDTARKAILRFKFGGKRASAQTLAAFILLKAREMEARQPEVITFVPMHFIRRGMRGYNQAELLAKALGEMWNVPVEAMLRKKKHTPPQSKRSRRQRLVALRDAYAPLQKAEVRGKRVLLVDDVITTGSTMQACARILRAEGAREVQIAAVAGATHH